MRPTAVPTTGSSCAAYHAGASLALEEQAQAVDEQQVEQPVEHGLLAWCVTRDLLGQQLDERALHPAEHDVGRQPRQHATRRPR